MQRLQLRGRRNDLVTIEGTSGNWYGIMMTLLRLVRVVHCLLFDVARTLLLGG